MQSSDKTKMMDDASQKRDLPKLIISLRGKKCDDFVWTKRTIISDVKSYLSKWIENGGDGGNGGGDERVVAAEMKASDVKLIYKGKILSDDSSNLYNTLIDHSKEKSINHRKNTNKKPIRLLAMAMSIHEVKRHDEEFNKAKLDAPRIRDDLTSRGKADIAARQRLGRKILQQTSEKESTTIRSISHSTTSSSYYGFHHIETLPMLPEQEKAKKILHSLSTDPGILACMAKHKWNVGCLAELYPEGNVGESEVCVMGLNKNKGQKILLRLRTDDLKGFRKILSIRNVLFHELAHNVHSKHDTNFFKLMRRIQKECNDMDWTKSAGHHSSPPTVLYDNGSSSQNDDDDDESLLFLGGTYVLDDSITTRNKDKNNLSDRLSTRELVARAAMKRRRSREEKEIQDACGCFQPRPVISEQSQTTTSEIEVDDDDMRSMS